MNRDDIRLVIATELGVSLESVTEEATWESLKADSLDKVQVMLRLEDNFDLGMTPDSTMADLSTGLVGKVIRYVEVQVDARRVGEQTSEALYKREEE